MPPSSQKKKNESSYDRFLRAAKTLGIPGVQEFLNHLIILDYIIANANRHLNNFGFLRDGNNLSWIGPAPLFDNGSSFGFDELNAEIGSNLKIVCKPFRNKHWEQLKLIKHMPALDKDALCALLNLVLDYFAEKGGRFIDKSRAEAIAKGLTLRMLKLKKLL